MPPEDVVQKQLDAYNARDIEAFMSVYTDDAEYFEHPTHPLAKGARQIRERLVARFRETNLHSKLLKRMVAGNIVIDHQTVTRTFEEGPGTLDVVAAYEVRNEKIVRAWFMFGSKILD